MSSQVDNEQYKDKPIHIFFETYATQPAFLGMIDLVQLPKDELKVIGWHRFLNRKEKVDLKEYNIIEIPLLAEEESEKNAKKFMEMAFDIASKNPNSPIILYTNINSYKLFTGYFLKMFPRERIKHIHLYEDGLGGLFTESTYFQSLICLKESNFNLNNIDEMKYSFHKFYPATYHMFGINEAKNKLEFHHFFKEMKDAHFEQIDFYQLKDKLTVEQKKLLYQFVGFNFEYYQKLFQKNDIFMFFGGHHGNKFKRYNAEISYFNDLIKKYPDYLFLFKPHPSYGSYNRNQIFKKNFPKVVIVNAKIPYEIFIIAGLEAEKFSGMASSLFYNLKNEKIESYFIHRGYEKGLDTFKKIEKTKKIDLDSYFTAVAYYDEKILMGSKIDYLTYHNGMFFSILNSDSFTLFLFGKKVVLYPNKKSYFSKETKVIYEKEKNIYVAKPINRLTIRNDLNEKIKLIFDGKYICDLNNKCGVIKNKSDLRLTICWEKGNCLDYLKDKKGDYSYMLEKVSYFLVPYFIQFLL